MYDVAIIGGGPSGSTCGALINQYDQSMSVVILEREKFPRDHVGESLLPVVSHVIAEMECWDAIEAAGFPIKIGATYRWGSDTSLWDFEFIPGAEFKDAERPSPFEGLRTFTAFQVDRSIYDKILLDHAKSRGCEIREETKVRTIERDGDRITGLILENGEKIEAKYYIDATGASGFLRRAMSVEVDSPTALRNIALWDYWQNADWAVEIGVDGTRILILSLEYGWLWFIPLGPTRTSIGFVVPYEYYKASGKTPEELYRKAIESEPILVKLMANSTCEGLFQTTNDWSFVSDRLAGENWFLVGDACGFADPILAAGLTLAHMSARQVAYTIIALDEGEHDAKWLKDTYNEIHKKRIQQHVKFADLWYSANGCFSDLREYTTEIAEKAGLTLNADDAFRWLATGGFAFDDPSSPILGGFALPAIKIINERLCETKSTWSISKTNRFKINLEGAVEDKIPILFNGQIWAKPCYKRDSKILPIYGFYSIAFKLVENHGNIQDMLARMREYFTENPITETPEIGINLTMSALEALIAEGWVIADVDPDRPILNFDEAIESNVIHANRDRTLAALQAE